MTGALRATETVPFDVPRDTVFQNEDAAHARAQSGHALSHRQGGNLARHH